MRIEDSEGREWQIRSAGGSGFAYNLDGTVERWVEDAEGNRTEWVDLPTPEPIQLEVTAAELDEIALSLDHRLDEAEEGNAYVYWSEVCSAMRKLSKYREARCSGESEADYLLDVDEREARLMDAEREWMVEAGLKDAWQR